MKGLVACFCFSCLLISVFVVHVPAQQTYLETGLTSTNRPGGLLGEIRLHTGIGSVSYEEDVSFEPVSSDFDAFLWTLGGDWTYVDRSGYKLRLRGAIWRSGSDTEEWTSRGRIVQKNDLQITAGDIVAEWGWQFIRREDRGITGWLGIGYTRQRFERSSFQLFTENPQGVPGSVDEDVDVVYVDFNLDGYLSVRPRWVATYLAGAGYVFYNRADNELLGTIDGEGGILAHIGAGLEYLLSENHRIGGGVRYEFQKLDGDTKSQNLVTSDGDIVAGLLEWPDNELDRLWFDIHWAGTF